MGYSAINQTRRTCAASCFPASTTTSRRKAARARFEDLFAQTDPVKQPREAELTQFKVFLTLLLEGKEPAARSFMDHFTFSGSTPARYFCQSALDFYHGDVDKAMGWLDSAKKEYPAQLVSIFIESFYRVGWMTDPTARPEVAAAATGANGAALPGASPAASPPAVVAAAPPVATPGATGPAAAKPAPVVASTGTAIAPVAASPAPAKAPVLAALTNPLASPAPASAKASPIVAAAPVAAAPVVLRPVSAPPAIALNPAPSPVAAPTAIAMPTHAPAVASAGTPAESTEAMEGSASATPAAEEEAAAGGASTAGELLRDLILIIVIVQTAFVWAKVGMAFKRRNARLSRGKGARPRSKVVEPDKVETP
jgi:hypothetical protein